MNERSKGTKSVDEYIKSEKPKSRMIQGRNKYIYNRQRDHSKLPDSGLLGLNGLDSQHTWVMPAFFGFICSRSG